MENSIEKVIAILRTKIILLESGHNLKTTDEFSRLSLKRDIETILNLIEKYKVELIETKEANRQLSIEIEQLEKENGSKEKAYKARTEELELEYQRILDIFDKRTYRKKYLEERRAEEKNLLYPDADEVYERYFKQKEKIQELEKEIKKLLEE